MKKTINILFAAFLMIVCVNAQSPNAFKYQAIVRDISGNLITNSIVAIQIDIVQVNVSGLVVYSESHYPTTNQFGLINLEIGNGPVISGSFSSIDWANGPYFIRISVNHAILGTSQLFSVPYAKYAEKAGNFFSGNYNDLTNKPSIFNGTWVSISGKPNFSDVALNGSYNNLTNKPTFNGTWLSLSGKPSFSLLSTNGNFNDLGDRPVIFSGKYNDLTNLPVLYDGTWNSLNGKPNFAYIVTSGNFKDLSSKPAFFNGSWGSLTGIPVLAEVAISGNYLNLNNLPTLFTASYTSLSDKPTLFSGNYNDLVNKPAPANLTWVLLSGKPSFSATALNGSYNDLTGKPTLFSGNYNDLVNIPTPFNWNLLTGKPTFLSIATSGNYNDLSEKPAFFDGTWNSLAGKPAKVATSGSYLDLIDLPTLFSGNYNELSNKPFIFSGNYNNLTNKPSPATWTWDLLSGKPNFFVVSTTGSYNDLSDKPTIMNWNWALVTGKPNFLPIAISGDYNNLSNKPTLFDGTWGSLIGNPLVKVATTGSYLDLSNLPALFSGSYNDLANKPSLFSGNYNDLANKPVLFDDTWSSIYGKPTFSVIAISGSYNDLLSKPNFNGNWSSLTGTPTTLSGYGITDGMSKSHPANEITNAFKLNWDNAYSWDNHAFAGYASAAIITTNYFTKTNLQNSAESSVHWGNIINTPTSIGGYGDFSISNLADNQLLKYNSSLGKWENWTPTFGSQQLSLSNNTLTISGAGGNVIPFTNWDTNSADGFTLDLTQTITGDKTFSGILTTSNTIQANGGLNANNGKITNIALPVDPQDMATKGYVDDLELQYTTLLNKYNYILAHFAVDYDGNIYKTVTIGTQTWMAENLKTLHYQNGDPIATTNPLNLNISDTLVYPEPRYTWPVFGDEANVPVFGRLYTWWVAVDPRQVCPSGWHVPSLDEFNLLLADAGGADNAGNNLKEVGPDHWDSQNAGNNMYGFSWVGNGNRYPDRFAVFRTYGCIYTSTSYNHKVPHHFHARTEYPPVYEDHADYHPKSMGSAIRCLK